MKSLLAIVFLAHCIACPGAFAGSVPKLINYQGKLTNAGGDELGDGQYILRFALFPAAGGGVAVWTEDQTVSLVRGVFSVALGSVTELNANAFGAAVRYLETTIVSGPQGAINQTLSPRQQMVSVPYALEAQNSERAAVATISEALVEQLAKALNPPGTIIAYAGAVGIDSGGLIEPVPGYLLCNGAVIDGTAEDGKYNALCAVLGSAWGNGGNAGNAQVVNLPDLRGVFLRGWNGGATDGYSDPDRNTRVARRAGGNTGSNVGAFQMDAFQHHQHGLGLMDPAMNVNKVSANGSNDNHAFIASRVENITGGANARDAGNAYVNVSLGGDARRTSESRGRNANVVYLIKY